MKKAPKSLRVHIALFGRTNVGKSSFLNAVTGQDTAITSARPGTTTDVVQKTMELLPIGPILFLDTAGLDDKSALSSKRTEKTAGIFDEADIAVLVSEPGRWGEYEEEILRRAFQRDIPTVVIVNKSDTKKSPPEFIQKIKKHTPAFMEASSIDRENFPCLRENFKELLLKVCPKEFITPPPLVSDLIPPNGLTVLIVPIDLGAPKGRLILPQVQTIRELLDSSSAVMTVRETEYKLALKRLKGNPDMVICDSQVVDKMVRETPPEVAATTFSILFSRLKGDLSQMVKGARMLDSIDSSSQVLISEACTHHPSADDIGRIKLPRWIREYTGKDPDIEICAGKDFPRDLGRFNLIIHCGGCMINRRLMLSRLEKAKRAGVAATNYGVAISKMKGVLERVLSPFPEVLNIYKEKAIK